MHKTTASSPFAKAQAGCKCGIALAVNGGPGTAGFLERNERHKLRPHETSSTSSITSAMGFQQENVEACIQTDGPGMLGAKPFLCVDISMWSALKPSSVFNVSDIGNACQPAYSFLLPDRDRIQ